MEHLETLIKFVRDCARRKGLSAKKVREVELATEEALSNIFYYAYPDKTDGDVEVNCMPNNTDLLIEFLDTGVPFDMLSISEPELTTNISQRKVGGLGIFLIRNIIDGVKYRRDGEKNILTFIIHKN